MADNKENTNPSNNLEESSPLLGKTFQENETKKSVNKETKESVTKGDFPPSLVAGADAYGWTVDGLPLGHGAVVGEPIGRTQWSSGLFSCLGRNDHFCSSDLEVCLLGSVAPCVLYGSNVERLGSDPGTFGNHCFAYSSLYLLGKALFGWNCLAPWYSYSSRTDIRRKFNLEGSCEALNRSCGCCGGCIDDEMQLELCETTCDFATHVLCHTCALCQEGRELRRRVPHPGFNIQPGFVMIPPAEQAMGRKAGA